MVKYSRLLLAALCVASMQTTAASAQHKTMSVQMGTAVPSAAGLNYNIAQKVGFLKQEGLTVEMRYTANASTAAQIVMAGNADVAQISFEPLIFGYAKGVRGKAILSLYNRLNYYIGVPEASSITSIADLKGKVIGISNVGSAAIPVVRSMMRSVGAVADKDYTLQPVGVLDQAIAALRADRVQAIAMWTSMFATMRRTGYAMRYLRHPTLADFGNAGLVASERTIKNMPEQICGLGRSLLKALVFAKENPVAAVKIYWELNPSARGSDEKVALEQGLKELEYLLSDSVVPREGRRNAGMIDRREFQRYMEMFKDEGGLEHVPPVDDLMTDQFIQCMNDFNVEEVRALARSWK